MFQAKYWSWRRLVASLVLAPGLMGLGADGLGLLGRAAGQERPGAERADEARELMRQARAAMDAQNYSKARELAEKARAMKAPAAFYEDAPEDLLAEMSRKGVGGTRTTANKPTTTDPKVLLDMAKKAYQMGDLERAQDLASQAQAHSGKARWGLFDDTPASVLKDVQKAKARRDKDDAEKLLVEARSLLARQAATQAERAANVNAAEEKAKLSARKHGEFSVWDFGDRPADVLADVKRVRDKEKLALVKPASKSIAPTGPTETVAKTMPTKRPTTESTGSDDAKKTLAMTLMQEGTAHKAAGNFVEARKRFMEASKLNASFSMDEDTPETKLAHLNVTAQRKINSLTAEAKSCLARKDEIAAKAKLSEAEQLASGMGLEAEGAEDLRAAMKKDRTVVQTGGRDEVTQGGPKPRPNDEPPIAVVPPDVKIPTASPDKAPPLPPVPATESADIILPPVKSTKLPADTSLDSKVADVIKPPMPMAPDKGKLLLDQARVELKNGDLDSARKLVTEILSGNYGSKEEASALLTSIDTKENERKIESAKRALNTGMDLYHAQNYTQALAVFEQIDGTMLSSPDRKKLAEAISAATSKQKAASAPKPMGTEAPVARAPMGEGAPVPTTRVGADNLIKQKEALSQVEFQKLRAKAMKTESDATARFGKGETDAALMDLQNFVTEVQASSLDASKQSLLIRPIEARIDRLRVLKHQTDFLTKEAKDRRNFRSEMAQEVLTKQKKGEEVAALMKQVTKLMDEAKYREAYAKVQMAQQLEPDDASVNATLQMAERLFRKSEFDRVKKNQEKHNWEVGNELFDFPTVNSKDPLKYTDDKEYLQRLKNRGPANTATMRTRSEAEKAIERKMSTPVSVNFKAMPLEAVVEHLQSMTAINFNLDLRGLKEGNVDAKQPISAKLENVSLKSALNIVCQQAGVKHVIEDETVRITTAKNAVGRQMTKTLSVGDLVVPAPNFGSQPGESFHDQMRFARESAAGVSRLAGGTPRMPQGGLPAGMGVGTGSQDLPGIPGKLTNHPTNGGVQTNGSGSNSTLEKELIRLITTTIKPDSWREMGGDGNIEYYPLGLALVINQSPEVIEEVERLLESLRKVQDLEVAIEVKVVSLGETFYERIGVDFAMGIRTNASPQGGPSGGSTTAGSNGGINSRFFSGNVIGLSAPRQPTPDLDIPIRATSFGRAVPPFGGFNNSFADGGISLGLAFLSDLQVQMFLDAAQGDTRTNVMQAPKVTALNGTSATINVGDVQFFLTGIQVANVGGELVFIPQNVPYFVGIAQPLPPNASIQNGLVNFTPTQPQTPGLYLAVQPVVSADRRFVRMNIQQSFTNLISGTQQIPVTTILQAQFANGGVGQPVPYTQFLQQPRFSNLEVQTVVVVPDGGTVVMGGLKYMTEGRNEFGPPVLSKIPYLNRLFKNVAYGREGRSILIMVTPRVIINREEQERQTGVSDDEMSGILGVGR